MSKMHRQSSNNEESKESLVTGKSVHEQILEFDLNQIFHLSYSFDILKKVIEKVASNIDDSNHRQQDALNGLRKEMLDKFEDQNN
jgi:hypothetical protein